MKQIVEIFNNNYNWAHEHTRKDPTYFKRLSHLQAPDYLWFGCADSRVPASAITGLEPGELFVHRNIANIVNASDTNCMAVLQYAIEHLKVRHIIVCGHYGCGGVHAALDAPVHGMVDYWLEPLRHLARDNSNELSRLTDVHAKANRLSELNVEEQVRNVANSPIVQQAWARGDEVRIYGWIYGLEDGRLHDLKCARAQKAA